MTAGPAAASPAPVAGLGPSAPPAPVPVASAGGNGTGGGGLGTAVTRALLAVAARCDAVARVWLAGATLAMAGLLIAQVVFRYAFNNSLFWSEELGRALLVQLTFIGASVAWRGRAHIGMDALVARFSPQWTWRARLLVLCVCVAFFAAVAWHGARFALFLLPQQTAALGVSRAVVFVAVPVGGALLTLHGLADLLAHIWPDASGESGPGGTGAGGAPLPCGTAGRDADDAGNEAGRDTESAAVSSSFTAPGGITPEGR